MKKLVLLFVIIYLPAFGQINFENGYFINNNGDKTECLIQNVAWQNNPDEINYKLNNESLAKKLTIADIKEFNIGNNYKYLRYKVNIDNTNSNINGLDFERNPTLTERIVFLKILVEGDINLYQYIDHNSIRYFISSGNHENAEQLVYKEYYNNDSEILENNFFKQQLVINLKSDKLTIEDFEKIRYKSKDLINLVQKFNATKNTKTTNFTSKQNQGSINLKIVTGVNQTALSYNSLSDQRIDFNLQNVFVIGLENEIVLSFNRNKWSLFLNPNFQYFKSSYGEKNETSFQEANYKFIEFPFGVRHYSFINNKSRLYIDAGFTFSFPFSSVIKKSDEVVDINSSTNLFAGIGFSREPFGVEVRYNSTKELYGTSAYWYSNSSIGLLLSYKIF